MGRDWAWMGAWRLRKEGKEEGVVEVVKMEGRVIGNGMEDERIIC